MNALDKAFDWNPRVLRSLQYFEAVARLNSVAAAAASLGVSPSAVSHQLRSLSAFIGEDLFVRSGRGLALSERGQRLQVQVASAFSDLASALQQTVGEKQSRLRIAVCSSFGPYWLAGKLPEFLARNPAIDVELRLYARDPEQSESSADAVVTAGPVREGFEAVPLFEERLVAVGKPDDRLDGQIAAAGFITTDVPPAPLGQDWVDFWRVTGRDPALLDTRQFVRCTHYLLALALAKAGIGKALVPDFVAAEALASGQVVLLDPARVSSARTYRLCYKTSRSKDPDLRALAKWIRTLSLELT